MVDTSISPRRLLDELAAMQRRYPTLRMLPRDVGAPTFEGCIVVDGVDHWVRLTLPPGYPSIPPELREITGSRGAVRTPAGALHRFPDGAICLFPHGNDPQAWHRDRLAAEALDQFQALVRVDRARAEGRGGLLFREPREVYVPTGIASLLRWPNGRGNLQLRMAADGQGDWFADGIDVEGESHRLADVLGPDWSRIFPRRLSVPWTYIPLAGRAWNEVMADRASLDAILDATLPAALVRRLRGEQFTVFVRHDAEHDLDSRTLDAILVHRPNGHLQALQMAPLTVAHPRELLFHRVDAALHGRDRLAEMRVIIVGLGSLGGAVALALARAGIRRFVLVDPDRLAITNICRHVGTIQDIGHLKVEVAARLLASIEPEVEVTQIPRWLAWDLPGFGAGVEIERMLAEAQPTLIVMTCATHLAERQLNARAVEHRVPVIYAAALGAAEHARVFRVIPGSTPCYECVLTAQQAEPTRYPQFMQAGAGEQEVYADPTLPGLGVDILQIAAITARFTLQTIARLRGVDIGFTDESGDHLLWTNRGGWIFDRPLQMMLERIPRSAACAVCADSPRADLSGEDEQRLQRLLAELSSSTSPA